MKNFDLLYKIEQVEAPSTSFHTNRYGFPVVEAFGGTHNFINKSDLHKKYAEAGYPYGKSIRGLKKFKFASD